MWGVTGYEAVASDGTSGTLPGGQRGPPSSRSWKNHPWKEHLGFISSLKCWTGSLVLQLYTGGMQSPTKPRQWPTFLNSKKNKVKPIKFPPPQVYIHSAFSYLCCSFSFCSVPTRPNKKQASINTKTTGCP